MITVKQLVQNTQPNESVGGYRNLLLQKYDWFRKHTKKQLIATKALEKSFLVYYKIQSESSSKIWYDVVIQFLTTDRIRPDTQIRVFNNAPQFMYTYAYCYNKQGDLLFPNKYDPIVLKEKPKEKNPKCLQGMDKHLYVAIKESIGYRFTLDKIKGLKEDKKAAEFFEGIV